MSTRSPRGKGAKPAAPAQAPPEHAPPAPETPGPDAAVLAPGAPDPEAGLPTVLPEDLLPPSLKEILERMPTDPGVYLMKDKKGKIIYVGKAQSLRSRVRSYFTRSTSDNRPFVALLDRLVGDIEAIVTTNEKEALLLENNLIKQHRPRFNVKLVDDKNYLVLRLDQRADYPRLEVMRRIRDDGARYFGPYHSATSCRQTLQVVNRHFKLRTCTDQVLKGRRRPCLQYQIKRCDAPCVFPVPPGQYGEQVRDVALFLDGKDQELTERLRERMARASEATEFEVAAAVRDQMRALERTLEEQRVVSAQFVDQDVFGRYREGDVLSIAVLHIRQGKLLGRRTYHFSGQEFPDEESLSSFIGLYYDMGNVIPDEVLLPVAIEDLQAKQDWLRELLHKSTAGRRGRRKVEILVPRRGPRARLLELASKNAEVAFRTRRDKKRDTQDALDKLQRRLSLKRPPRRIECFDISHLQGSFTVASMVVFIDGEPARSEYRTFKIKSARNDDFASMYEVLSRRFRRARDEMADKAADKGPAATAERGEEDAAEVAEVIDAGDAIDVVDVSEDAGEGEGEKKTGWGLPDLLVIDGGKGQLGSALAALKDVGIDPQLLDAIGLAKEREDESGEKQPDRVFLPRAKDPIKLRPNTAELFILSRIRDEAHRFAVTFHEKQRHKRTIRSRLEDVPGVGEKRRQALLRAFGSLRKVQQATVAELAAVRGMSPRAAQAVFDFLGGATPEAPLDAEGPAPSAAPAEIAEADPGTAENAAERELSALDKTAAEAEALAPSGPAPALEDLVDMEELARVVTESSSRGPAT